MAKTKKILKSLEAEGWRPVAERDGLIQLAHPERSGRITLPSRKASLPPPVWSALAARAGVKLKSA